MSEVKSHLNNLLEYLHDSCDGYKECSQTVNNDRLKELFNNLVKLREKMITELEQLAKEMAIRPEKTGSTAAAAHRLFVDLKSMMTNGDPKSIVEEIKRGENLTIKNYQEALDEEDIPLHVKDVIRRQLSEIQSNLTTVQWKTETETT